MIKIDTKGNGIIISTRGTSPTLVAKNSIGVLSTSTGLDFVSLADVKVVIAKGYWLNRIILNDEELTVDNYAEKLNSAIYV